MPITWKEIERDWIAGSPIARTPEVIVDAFARVDRLLGTAWIDARRHHGAWVKSGFAPTLAVVSTGLQLQAIEGCAGSQELIAEILAGNRAAFAELEAIYLARAPGVEVEIGPEVAVGNRVRKPDFRMRAAGEEWIYAEVAAPDKSELRLATERVLQELVSLLDRIQDGSAIEVFFLREPRPDEIPSLIVEIERVAAIGVRDTYHFGDLALLPVNHQAPGLVSTEDHGMPVRHRICQARWVGVGGVPTKHIAVRYPFTDERAEEFVSSEARQLPKGFPGLIMLDTSDALGGLKGWIGPIQDRLQPNLHTRVGAVSLFQSATYMTCAGMDYAADTRTVQNPNARFRLPAWLFDRLESFKPPPPPEG